MSAGNNMQKSIQRKPSRGPKPGDKYIPWYFVAFFVGLAILDGIFVFIATSTHRGVVTEQAYRKGLNYNRTVEAAAIQQARGWQGVISMEEQTVSFNFKDKEQQPLSNAQVTAYFFRPTQEGHDFSVTLRETEPGTYRHPVNLPLQGQWEVKITAQWEKQHYQQRKRLVITPR